MNVHNFFTPTLAVLALILVAGCGGGSGDSSSPVASASAPVTGSAPDDETGVVGIIIKDAPSDDYTQILMRITRVELLGNGDPQVVFEGDLEFDLLSLRNHANLLSLSDEVAVGEYDKIRLRVSSITLYCLDENGDEVSRDVRVPANGKVDLNPRGTFTVAANSALLIQIDLDARKSIHIVGTGNDDFRFRPVVFVDIDERQIPEGLIRVSGVVGQISDDPSYFELCRLDDVHVDSLSDGCIRVNTDGATAFFNGDGVPIDPDGQDELVQGESVTVFAEAIVVPIEERDDDVSIDGDTIRMVQLYAFVVHKGDPEDVLSLDGTASDAVDDDLRFNFQVGAGQELPEELISVQLHRNTRILSGADLSDLDPSVIQRGTLAEVSGMVWPGIPEDPTNFSAALIVIEEEAPPAAAGPTELEGSVVRLNAETFTVRTANEEPSMDRCVAPLPDARYLTVMDSGEGADHSEVDADYLALEQTVSVFGAYGEGDCFEADTIIIDETPSDD